ncbi:MAG: protein-L-isoaspartate(D-aspartate) O-methyltransferase [Planctomycetota bacterium]
MAETQGKHASYREQMVLHQLVQRGIEDQRVLDAFRVVPREAFMGDVSPREAYADAPRPIGHGQTISQPYIVAVMLEALGVQPTDRVLDIGLGSGYQTALLAKLAEHVYAIERIETLTKRADGILRELEIDNVTTRTGDGTLGWPEHAPFDRIISGAGGPKIPEPWVDQLAEGGRLICPVGPEHTQHLMIGEKRDGILHETTGCGVRFVRLIGEEGWQPSGG